VSRPENFAGTRNRWFEKRRDFFVRQLVDDFFELIRSFQATYLLYLESRDPLTWSCTDLMDDQSFDQRTDIWDSLAALVGTENQKGPLWKLKDLCHQVWPESDQDQDVSGSLLDWLVGSIFHETMKLKENIYLLNRYGPAACRLKDRPLDLVPSFRRGVPSVPRMENIVDVRGLISRAATDAVRQMEQISFLFCHASFILRVMMPALAGNSLVVRLLIEQEETVGMLWGEELEEIFADMFYGDSAEGFCTAGRSYLSGHWFARALRMYQRALAIDSTCDEAITRMVQLQAVVRENRELLGAV